MIDSLIRNPTYVAILTFIAGLILTPLAKFAFRDLPGRLLDQGAKEQASTEEWVRDCKKHLTEIQSIGDQILARNRIDPDLFIAAESEARSLRQVATGPPKPVRDEAPEIAKGLDDFSKAILIFVEAVSHANTSSFTEFLTQIKATYDRSWDSTYDSDLEQSIDKFGGMPTGSRGDEMSGEETIEFIEMFFSFIQGEDLTGEIQTMNDIFGENFDISIFDLLIPEEQKVQVMKSAIIVSVQGTFIQGTELLLRKLDDTLDAL